MKKLVIFLTVALPLVAVSQTVTNIVYSKNETGLLKVESSLEYTPVVIPFNGVAIGNTNIVVQDIVKTGPLTANANASLADQLITYDRATGLYRYYWLKADANGVKLWNEMTTVEVTRLGEGGTGSWVAPDPEVFGMVKGFAFWVRRRDVNAPIYIHGQMPKDAGKTQIVAGSMETPSYNLVGRISLEPFDLNGGEVDWVAAGALAGMPEQSDEIQIMDAQGAPYAVYYFYSGSASSRFHNKWIKIVTTATSRSYAFADPIPAGFGFWYVRRGISKIEF